MSLPRDILYPCEEKKICFLNYNIIILRVQKLYSTGQFSLIVKITPLGSKGLKIIVFSIKDSFS
jgi:hypothetical protein